MQIGSEMYAFLTPNQKLDLGREHKVIDLEMKTALHSRSNRGVATYYTNTRTKNK